MVFGAPGLTHISSASSGLTHVIGVFGRQSDSGIMRTHSDCRRHTPSLVLSVSSGVTRTSGVITAHSHYGCHRKSLVFTRHLLSLVLKCPRHSLGSGVSQSHLVLPSCRPAAFSVIRVKHRFLFNSAAQAYMVRLEHTIPSRFPIHESIPLPTSLSVGIYPRFVAPSRHN